MRLLSAMLCAVLIGTASSDPALADDKGSPLDRLLICEAQRIDAARLACFDAELSAVRRLRERGVPLAELGRPKVPRREFIPVASTVSQVEARQVGFWRIVLADGSVWRNSQPVEDLPRVGARISIRKGALGSVRATTGSIQGALVRPEL